MSCAVAFPLILSTVFSAVNALDVFYHPLEGTCSDLDVVHDFDDHKIASGKWYNQYVSYGQEGDKCATLHIVERGTKNYIDFMLYDKEANRYELFPDDLEYRPEHPGTYANSHGGIAYMLASDVNSYCFGYQCVQENGEAKVVTAFVTREREMSAEEKKVYQNITSVLAKKKLLPKMFKMSQKDCPPEYKLKIEHPA